MVCELLKNWGLGGFLTHADKVRDFYHKQRGVMLAAAEKHLSGIQLFELDSEF